MNGNLATVKTCVNQGVDAKVSGQPVLHSSSAFGHLEAVKYLIEICEVDKEAKSNLGWTTLHAASYNGHSEVVKYLIETCKVDKEARGNDGPTAIWILSNT